MRVVAARTRSGQTADGARCVECVATGQCKRVLGATRDVPSRGDLAVVAGQTCRALTGRAGGQLRAQERLGQCLVRNMTARTLVRGAGGRRVGIAHPSRGDRTGRLGCSCGLLAHSVDGGDPEVVRHSPEAVLEVESGGLGGANDLERTAGARSRPKRRSDTASGLAGLPGEPRHHGLRLAGNGRERARGVGSQGESHDRHEHQDRDDHHDEDCAPARGRSNRPPNPTPQATPTSRGEPNRRTTDAGIHVLAGNRAIA